MTAGTRQKMIVITLVVVIAVLAVTGVSLAVWISGEGEGASYDFEVMGWGDPSVRYLRFSAKGEGGEDLVLAFDDAAGCFVAKNGGAEYVGAVSEVTAIGYYGIIEELLIPAQIFVKTDGGGTVEGISVEASAVDVVAVAMPNIQQDGGEALGLVTELTIGAKVASISAHSFSYMDALTKVTFESGAPLTLGNYCFFRCGNLTEIVEDGRSVTRGTGCFE
ncbi:MAG TPA: leucine-rich repeat protein [Candidatus Ornithoclostridium faecigallinarum]|nr:leucine-rich repeat protein [Candidatus Ornithoclostridium faecigallinarum]